jgi:protein-L-isoaspartate(D-aspartate) O-methyltransferase
VGLVSDVASSDDVSALLQSLVDYLKREDILHSPRVEAAFRAIPRHLFLPGVPLEQAYSDEAIPTKRLEGRAVSSSSQPAIMAIMLEQLELEPGHRVLEIGAGTGYNAALMAHIVGERGQVITLDIDEDIVENARTHLQAAGFDRVQVIHGDGGFGYPEGAPYDRIILTVGSSEIAPAWREQLKPGGRLVMPLSLKGPQKCAAFQKTDSYFVSVSLKDCGFMSLRGAFAEPEHLLSLGPEPGLHLSMDDPSRVDPDAIYRLLSTPGHDQPTGVRATSREIWGGLNPWLALREPGVCGLEAEGEMVERGLVPCLLEISGAWRWCFTTGLIGEASLSVLTRSPEPGSESAPRAASFEIFVRTFGPELSLGQRLLEQVQTWDALGRPGTERLRIRAYPLDTDYHPAEHETVILKRWTRLVLDWPSEML